MKTLMAILNDPVMVFLSSLVGTAVAYYLQNTALQAFYWFIPCLAVIFADLVAGIKAAMFRGETVRFSGAMRRTLNKCMCYASWIICCVALNERYSTSLCAYIGIGIIFIIEGISFVSNLLEPHGIKLSIKGILKIIGSKSHIDGLEDVIEKPTNHDTNVNAS